MKTITLILFFCAVSMITNAQTKDTTKINDSIPVISIKEFGLYLERLNDVTKRQFDLTDESVSRYQTILREMQLILSDVRREKGKKK